MNVPSNAHGFTKFALALVAIAGAPVADGAAPFYEGKVLTIVVGGPAGSGYDLYARIFAPYLAKYIPGHPTIVIQNMPGASGVLSSSYMMSAAPRDGTMIGITVSTVPTAPVLHPEMAKFDSSRFSWIGNITNDIYIGYVWNSAPIQTYEEAKQRQVILGGSFVGSSSVDLPLISNSMFGTKFKIVAGYGDQDAIKLALERGEVQGSFGGVYSSVKIGAADWLAEKKIHILLQFGYVRLPELADVPLFIDQAKTPEDRELLKLVLAAQVFAKPVYGPPDVPTARLDLLRRAFDSAVQDPGFLDAAAQARINVSDPMTGEQLATSITQVMHTPQALVERVKHILASFRPN